MSNEPKVWVVDDDDDDQYLICSAFIELVPPVRVKSFYNGAEVITHLKMVKTVPQLILLDLNMPGINGLDVLRQARAIPTYQEVPIIILTTSFHSADEEKAIELGATNLLLKPSTFDKLSALVQQLVIKWEVAY